MPTTGQDREYAPIGDYAIIGDCGSAALISRSGSIDWLCWPGVDSPSIVAALIDSESGGFFQVAPAGSYDTSRHYIDRTNVLCTRFEAPSGILELTDFMPVAHVDFYRENLLPDHQIIRRLECIQGEVEVIVRVDLRPGYGKTPCRLALAEMTRRGCDKVTIITPPSIEALGLWLEQLLAESTGKEGKGIIPVALEPLGGPEVYGEDRLFVYFGLRGDLQSDLEKRVEELRDADHPVITITLGDRLDLAQEFYRWEFATAVAGGLLNLNAFDQPNVQESKDNTRTLLEQVSGEGKLPELADGLNQDGLKVYGGNSRSSLSSVLKTFLGRIQQDGYLALLAYLPEEEADERLLQEIRAAIRDNLRVTTTLGFGPRYLHSTGQLHKGGPGSGAYLQITATHSSQLGIPDRAYDFETLQAAQAIGDYRALQERGRPVLQIHLTRGIEAGLKDLEKMVRDALQSS